MQTAGHFGGYLVLRYQYRIFYGIHCAVAFPALLRTDGGFSEAALQINDSQNVGRDVHLSRIPRTLDKSLPWNPSNGRGESHGYQWQEP